MQKTILFLFVSALLLVSCKGQQTVEKFIVASQQGDCMGVAPMKCFLVKKDGGVAWELFYDAIEGFNYEPGYEYILEVKVDKIENPAADQSAFKYTLIKEVSKEQKTSENLPVASEPNQVLTIASQQGDCMGVAPMKCLFVKTEGATDWEFFYDAIEGFNYEPGYEYVLEVKVDKVENPVADQSALKYTLVKEISKDKKNSENLPTPSK